MSIVCLLLLPCVGEISYGLIIERIHLGDKTSLKFFLLRSQKSGCAQFATARQHDQFAEFED